MKCDICKTKDATVHLTEVINDKVTKLHLCEECAKEKGEEMQSHFGLTDLLSGLMDLSPTVQAGRASQTKSAKCPGCGMTYFDFQQTGRLGCGKCYEAFQQDLGGLLRKIHGSDKHMGKMPYKGEDVLKEQHDLHRLKNELAEMVRSEEFEKAAMLRDRIRQIEEKMKGEAG